MRKHPYFPRALVWGLFGVLLIGLFTPFGCRAASDGDRAGRLARESSARLSATESLRGRVREAESALANYLVVGPVGGEKYLVAYRSARAAVLREAAALDERAARTHDHDHRARVQTVAALAVGRVADCEFIVSECDAGRRLFATNYVREGEGLRKREVFAVAADELTAAECGHRDEAERRADTSRTVSMAFVFAGAFMGIVYCGFTVLVAMSGRVTSAEVSDALATIRAALTPEGPARIGEG